MNARFILRKTNSFQILTLHLYPSLILESEHSYSLLVMLVENKKIFDKPPIFHFGLFYNFGPHPYSLFNTHSFQSLYYCSFSASFRIVDNVI